MKKLVLKAAVYIPAICILLSSLYFAIASAHEEEEPAVELPAYLEWVHKLIDNYGIVSVAVVLASALLFFFVLKKIMSLITFSIIVALILVVGYGILAYYSAGAEKGIVVCKTETECVKALHIHTDVEGSICGEELRLPLDKGDPTKLPHTHKERNLIHWEAELKVDPATEEILDYTMLKVGTFMDVMGIRLNATCLGNYCNMDKCPDGKEGTVKMLVNGQENNEFREYVWKDGDKIRLVFE